MIKRILLESLFLNKTTIYDLPQAVKIPIGIFLKLGVQTRHVRNLTPMSNNEFQTACDNDTLMD